MPQSSLHVSSGSITVSQPSSHTPDLWPPLAPFPNIYGIAFFCQFIALPKAKPSCLPLHQPLFLMHLSDFAGTQTHTHTLRAWGRRLYLSWTKNVTLSEEITGLQQRLCFNALGLAHSWLTQKYECVRNVFVSVNVKVGESKHCVHVYLQFCVWVSELAYGVTMVKLFFQDSGKKNKTAVSWVKWLFWQTVLGHFESECVCLCVCVS